MKVVASQNREIEQYLKKRVAIYEKEFGEIPVKPNQSCENFRMIVSCSKTKKDT